VSHQRVIADFPTAGPAPLGIYGVRTCMSHIVGRDHAAFEAFDARGRWLGIFPTDRAAADAINSAQESPCTHRSWIMAGLISSQHMQQARLVPSSPTGCFVPCVCTTSEPGDAIRSKSPAATCIGNGDPDGPLACAASRKHTRAEDLERRPLRFRPRFEREQAANSPITVGENWVTLFDACSDHRSVPDPCNRGPPAAKDWPAG
jgi:hypothetical protein